MDSLNHHPELSLDFKPTSIPKSITQFMLKVSKFGSLCDNKSTVNDVVSRLETEMRKIHAFERELPLCMLLVNDVIIALKEEAMVLKKLSVGEPVVEEFMPIKKSCDQDSDADKKNWLSSTQLWNNNGDTDSETSSQIQNQKPNSTDQTVKKGCGFELESPIPLGIKSSIKGDILDNKTMTSPNDKWVASSLPNGQSNLRTGASHGSPAQQQTYRKQRRCWSSELHRRFVDALQQLGGSQAATPKQIRELMQVDDLTNDEVKSHLQKYRLHTRRLPSSNTSSANQSECVLGGRKWLLGRDQYVESSKHGIFPSGSPDGPLLLCTTPTTAICGDSMDDGEDAKSENY